MKVMQSLFLPRLVMVGLLASSWPLSADMSTSVPLTQYRPENSSYQLRASDLIGKSITGAQEQTIGEIDDLLFRRSTPGIEVVISIGGFLGIGDQLVAVPYDELRISIDGSTLFYEATQEKLSSLEAFEYENDEQWGTAVRGTPEGGLMDQLGVDKGDQGVDWNKLDNNWDAFKQAATVRWGKLTPDDWQAIEANRKNVLPTLSEITGQSTGDLELELGDMVDSF